MYTSCASINVRLQCTLNLFYTGLFLFLFTLTFLKQREALFSRDPTRRDDRTKEVAADKPKDEKEISGEELNKIKVKYLGAPPVKKKVRFL